jgi:hypothetical protein
MMMRYAIAVPAALLMLCCATANALTCDALKQLKLPHTTITESVLVAAGAFKDPAAPWAPEQMLPERCQVKATLTPVADSHINIEIWMPASGWNHKFQGAGNGGFAGSITYNGGLVQALQRGYAGASTDTGHAETGEDASWAIGHPEKLVDFAHRSVHLMTVAGKAIVKAFYGMAPAKSYFSSCSNGGRQALMLAQRYPDDYDGIVAGAPANDWTGLMLDFLWNEQALMKPGAFIPADHAAAIQAAVNDQCDALDGVTDGVIGRPQSCRFKTERLLCSGEVSNSCLTQPQITALRAIYQGMHSTDGRVAFQGFTPGAEVGGWDNWIFGKEVGATAQARFALGFMRGMVLGDANWQPGSFDFDRDAHAVIDRLAPILNATNPNLGRFAAHGGKLILFHGWADPAIPPLNSVRYYTAIGTAMGAQRRGEFVRLFMAPGMQHCFGGPGPSGFGGIAAAIRPEDPSDDLSAALEKWVESGVAPEAVRAVKPKNMLPAIFNAAAGGVERTGLLCAYPKVAKWNGSGSSDDAANYSCVADQSQQMD